jgi:hypothetical protein
MQMLLLYYPGGQRFDCASVTQILWSVDGFSEMRFDEPGGALVEAIYTSGQSRTIVRLDSDAKMISFSGQSDAALFGALAMQQHLRGPIHIIDLDNAFDLVLADYPTLDQLRTAIETAQNAQS